MKPTTSVDDLTIRPLESVDELEIFFGLQYTLDDEVAGDFARGLRRPEWTWIALRGERLIARAAWWGPAEDADPSVFDFLDIGDAADRVDVGLRLIRTALGQLLPAGGTPPGYTRFIAPDWREQPRSRRLIQDLMSIVEHAGGRLVTERFRFEWRPGTPIAAPTSRLAFRSVTDTHELLELMTLTMDGTLDAHSRKDLARMSAQEAARLHFRDELALYSTPRAWWRIATMPGGQPVGFVIPAHNGYGPVMAYLGVVPDQRGHGYIDEILAEGTRMLVAHDPPRIRASTDLGNTPMADAFVRAGWVNFERSISMSWDEQTESVPEDAA